MSVSVDGGISFTTTAINPAQVSSGKITLAGMSAGAITIKFHATGYLDATVNQVVIGPTAEVRVKTTNSKVVEVEEARALVFVNKDAKVSDILLSLISYNSTTQTYKIVYSDGDDMMEYAPGSVINPNLSVALHVKSQDSSTIGYYTILINQ
ncbi:hypothetical protein FG384_03295 [Psychrobacillus vulpis]|uniref:Heme-binding protein Shr-like Hb-interacting domain-containing protein n=2 Tax=Psychrobacillus vulpis TaxID=2325572 RepID=A0A544TUY0_9BACI|nr:hypothetical protein [Psychrobacillus vulpis]TQR21246.1 hypothetical protein FG384_03295 [Psychrobacillus vulpis]